MPKYYELKSKILIKIKHGSPISKLVLLQWFAKLCTWIRDYEFGLKKEEVKRTIIGHHCCNDLQKFVLECNSGPKKS